LRWCCPFARYQDGEAFSFFGSESVFFIMGVFIRQRFVEIRLIDADGAASSSSGLEVSTRLIFQVMLTSGLLSFIMSEHAVAAMMFPVVQDRQPAQPVHGEFFLPNSLLAMAWGCDW
jgi:sodium-dependent dicarboxylate transporter 2/3/5